MQRAPALSCQSGSMLHQVGPAQHSIAMQGNIGDCRCIGPKHRACKAAPGCMHAAPLSVWRYIPAHILPGDWAKACQVPTNGGLDAAILLRQHKYYLCMRALRKSYKHAASSNESYINITTRLTSPAAHTDLFFKWPPSSSAPPSNRCMVAQ